MATYEYQRRKIGRYATVDTSLQIEMPRTCTICNHPDRKIIDAMIANKDSYLQIATRFGLNNKTVTTHGHKCVEPFLDSIELQAQAAVLARVREYRDEVNLPLPEKSKYIEDKLWTDFDAAGSTSERMAVMREINKQQVEQAKLAGAYVKDKENPADALAMARRVVEEAKIQGLDVSEAARRASKRYGVLEADLIGV